MAHGAKADGPAGGGETSAPELVAARELFRQGAEDADAGRYAQALDKFRRVAAVKETANVRFNIARCEESLGKTGGALADFELAEREGKSDDVARLAHDRAAAIRPRVPRLGVTAPSPPPDGLTVTLDGAKLAVAALGAPLPVDPGAHVIVATAPGRDPFRAEVTIAEAEARTVPIAMAPGDPSASGSGGATSSDAASDPSSSRHVWGGVTLAASGALVIGSVAFLLLHDSAVSSVEAACPNDKCPASRESSVTSDESKARTSETLSVVFAAGAVVGAGIGLYLVLGSPSSPAAPSVAVTPRGFSLTGHF